MTTPSVPIHGLPPEVRGRGFSGMRPSGRLHLGNYLGALQNRAAFQDDYHCVCCAADVHALTTVTSADDARQVRPNTREMGLDWLAAGLDPQRLRRSDPGRPEVCHSYTLHTIVNAPRRQTVDDEGATARRGCVACKGELADAVNAFLGPFRERRRQYEARSALVDEALADGAAHARTLAQETLRDVRQRLGLDAVE